MSIIAHFETWPLVPALLTMVGLFAIVAVAGAHCSHRVFAHSLLACDNDAKGVVLSVVGVVYAVVLGFVAIGVWERFDQAEIRTYDEAANLQVAYRDADSFPERAALRTALRGYTAEIISYDWTCMERSEQAPLTRVRIERLLQTIRDLPVKTAAQQDVHAETIQAFRAALSDRDARLSMSETGLNPIMWFVLFAGALLTVGFTCVLGFRLYPVRIFMLGALGAMIGLVLYLTISLDYPFRGAVRVTPEAFSHAIYNYDLIDRATAG